VKYRGSTRERASGGTGETKEKVLEGSKADNAEFLVKDPHGGIKGTSQDVVHRKLGIALPELRDACSLGRGHKVRLGGANTDIAGLLQLQLEVFVFKVPVSSNLSRRNGTIETNKRNGDQKEKRKRKK